MKPDDTYDYTSSGFDSFLSRSIDDLSQINLDSTGPRTTALRYDSAQVSGALGDILRIGKIQLDGVEGSIALYDDDNATIKFYVGPRR